MFASIRSRVLAACLTIVGCALIANTSLNYGVAKRYNTVGTNQNLNAILIGHGTGIEDWVAAKAQMIVSVEDAALTADPTPALKAIAAAGGFTSVYVGYPDKTMWSSNATRVPAGFDPTSRPWYKQAARAGRLVVTAPYVDVRSGKLVVAFAAPILRDGVLKAVASGDVAMDSVISNIQSIHPTPASFGMLVDRNGLIVANSDVKLTLRPITELVPGLAMEGLIASSDAAAPPLEAEVDGKTKLIKTRAVSGTTWLTLVALDKAEATAGMHSLLLSSIGALALLLIIAATIFNAVVAVAFKKLFRVCDAMESIGSGSGDLTQRLPDEGRDEVAQIARSFNTFVSKICDVIIRIKNSSESVRHAASEIASGNHDLSRRTEAAAASLEETVASMDQITQTVRHSSSAAHQANATASKASQAALRGGTVVSEVVSTMDEIERASGKISAIIGVIEGIAFQTNILALNAAVEAARAGEEGRGFAVVAAEVRTLAQRSAHAAKEIKGLIDSNVSSVSAGATLVKQAGHSMDDIVVNVSKVTTIMVEITNASDEQNRGIQEINRAVAQLDEMVQQNASLVEQSAAAASALQTQANELASAVGQFKVD